MNDFGYEQFDQTLTRALRTVVIALKGPSNVLVTNFARYLQTRKFGQRRHFIVTQRAV